MRRSWLSQEQKAPVIGSLIEESGAWRVEQKRVQDEANRKRSDSAKQQPRTKNGFAKKGNTQIQSQSVTKPVLNCIQN